MQLLFGSFYILILALYLAVICLPEQMKWNLSVYRTEIWGRSRENTFTLALYKCIVVTKSNDWIKRSQAAPTTPAWNGWFNEVLEHTENVHLSIIKPVKDHNREYDEEEDGDGMAVFAGMRKRL
jgi:hypothetical protein